uniref:Transmembrane protein n=1 Tax=Heterorhabditis bacteriophora TaxID=37862 RepID=A0A1I7WKH7_HETBA
MFSIALILFFGSLFDQVTLIMERLSAFTTLVLIRLWCRRGSWAWANYRRDYNESDRTQTSLSRSGVGDNAVAVDISRSSSHEWGDTFISEEHRRSDFVYCCRNTAICIGYSNWGEIMCIYSYKEHLHPQQAQREPQYRFQGSTIVVSAQAAATEIQLSAGYRLPAMRHHRRRRYRAWMIVVSAQAAATEIQLCSTRSIEEKKAQRAIVYRRCVIIVVVVNLDVGVVDALFASRFCLHISSRWVLSNAYKSLNLVPANDPEHLLNAHMWLTILYIYVYVYVVLYHAGRPAFLQEEVVHHNEWSCESLFSSSEDDKGKDSDNHLYFTFHFFLASKQGRKRVAASYRAYVCVQNSQMPRPDETASQAPPNTALPRKLPAGPLPRQRVCSLKMYVTLLSPFIRLTSRSPTSHIYIPVISLIRKQYSGDLYLHIYKKNKNIYTNSSSSSSASSSRPLWERGGYGKQNGIQYHSRNAEVDSEGKRESVRDHARCGRERGERGVASDRYKRRRLPLGGLNTARNSPVRGLLSRSSHPQLGFEPSPTPSCTPASSPSYSALPRAAASLGPLACFLFFVFFSINKYFYHC